MHLLDQYFGTAVTCRYTTPGWLMGPGQHATLRHTFEMALSRTILRHPVLQAGLVDQASKRPSFIELDSIDLNHHVEWRAVNPSEDYDDILKSALQAQLDTKFSHQETRPLWRVAVLQQDVSKSLEVIFTWNHPISDGMGAKMFHETLLHFFNTPLGDDEPPVLKDHVLTITDTSLNFPPSQDKMCKYSLSMSYSIGMLWKELKPQSLRLSSGTMATWAPIQMLPHKTQLRSISVEDHTLQNVLVACRRHKTTLTGLLHSIILISLSSQLPADQAPGFQGQTAINMRPFTPSRPPGYPHLEPRKTMGVIISAMEHAFDKSLVARVRSQVNSSPPGADGRASLEGLVWSVAVTTREELRETLAMGVKDNLIGVMGLVPDWRPLLRDRAKGPRSVGWLVSNLGVLDGAPGKGGWKIDKASFSICAEVAGAAINVCPIGVKGRDLRIDFTWQEGVVNDGLGERLGRDVQDWLAHVGKTQR